MYCKYTVASCKLNNLIVYIQYIVIFKQTSRRYATNTNTLISARREISIGVRAY